MRYECILNPVFGMMNDDDQYTKSELNISKVSEALSLFLNFYI